MKPNVHDQETIDVFQRAERHIGGGCGCPERLSDGPSDPGCVRAIELATYMAQEEVLNVLAKHRHEVWVTSMLNALGELVEKQDQMIEKVEDRVDELER